LIVLDAVPLRNRRLHSTHADEVKQLNFPLGVFLRPHTLNMLILSAIMMLIDILHFVFSDLKMRDFKLVAVKSKMKFNSANRRTKT
jgi:hypothetical protein